MSVKKDIECDRFQNTNYSTVLDCWDRMRSGILTPFLFSSLYKPCTSSGVLFFFLCGRDWSNKMPFCQTCNGFFSWNLWRFFHKKQRANATSLEIKQWLSPTTFFVRNKAIQQ